LNTEREIPREDPRAEREPAVVPDEPLPPPERARARPAHLIALRAALGGGVGGALASTFMVACVAIDRGQVPRDSGLAWVMMALSAGLLCGLSLLAEDLARHVARLRGLVVIGVAATTAAVIGGAVAWAMAPHKGGGQDDALSAQAELIDAIADAPGKALVVALAAMTPPLCMATLRLAGARWHLQALGNAVATYGALVTFILALDGGLSGTGEAQATFVGMALVATLGMLAVDRALARQASPPSVD
jgi:hypothetical protein